MNLKKKNSLKEEEVDELVISGGDPVPSFRRVASTPNPGKPTKRFFAMALIIISIVAAIIWSLKPSTSSLSIDDVSHKLGLQYPSTEAVIFKLGNFSDTLSSPNQTNWLAEINVTVGENQTLSSIFLKLGLSETLAVSAAQILKRLEAEHQFKPLISAGTALTFKFNNDSVLNSIVLNFPRNRQIELRAGDNEKFTPVIKVDDQLMSDRTAFGTIETTFSEAALKAGVDYDVIDDFVDLFSDRVEFKRELQTGDRFTLVYRKRDPLKLSKAGEPIIIAAAMEVNGKQLFVARFQGADGKYRYFDERGQPLGNTFLRYPLKFSRISSYFTNSRFHPVLKVKRPHNGIDFAAPTGTPVRTVADGIVVQAGYNGGAGNMVKISHGDRYSTAYLHLSSITGGVKAGARVKRGDVIGAVGSTGLATGPHLHFSFFDRDVYVDPFKIKLPTLDLLPTLKMSDTYLKRVLETLNHFQSIDITQLRKILKTPNRK